MTETLEQTCQRIVEARGYLVINSPYPLTVGEVIPSLGQRSVPGEEELNQKTVVISETNAQDHVDQCDFIGIRRGYHPFPYFYRVIAE